MSAAFIGGNLESLGQVATRLQESGNKALQTTDGAQAAAQRLTEAIEASMGELLNQFNTVASDLTADISQAHEQLRAADWQGASYENAVAIKGDLQSQVERVLADATASMEAEKVAFVGRAEALVERVQVQFGSVMTNVQGEYSALADASTRTMQNLEAADQTIRLG